MPKIILRSFEEENKHRRKMRLIFALISLPFVLIASLFIFKVFTTFIETEKVITAYETGEHETASRSLEPLKSTNLFQQWLVYFNSGTVKSAAGDYPEALSDLRVSLGLVDNLVDECVIRANLALTYEKYGDEFNESGNVTQADIQYGLAVSTFEEAPPECFPSQNTEGEGDAGESLEETSERSENKQSGNQGNPDGESDGEQGERTPEEQIEDQLEQSQRDREAIEGLDREEQGSGGESPNYEKPW